MNGVLFVNVNNITAEWKIKITTFYTCNIDEKKARSDKGQKIWNGLKPEHTYISSLVS